MSTLCNNYAVVMYGYNTKSILIEPFANRRAAYIIRAWKRCYNTLKYSGHVPSIHILDNECSTNTKVTFMKEHITFQAIPPFLHQYNAAERIIQA